MDAKLKEDLINLGGPSNMVINGQEIVDILKAKKKGLSESLSRAESRWQDPEQDGDGPEIDYYMAQIGIVDELLYEIDKLNEPH